MMAEAAVRGGRGEGEVGREEGEGMVLSNPIPKIDHVVSEPKMEDTERYIHHRCSLLLEGVED